MTPITITCSFHHSPSLNLHHTFVFHHSSSCISKSPSHIPKSLSHLRFTTHHHASLNPHHTSLNHHHTFVFHHSPSHISKSSPTHSFSSLITRSNFPPDHSTSSSRSCLHTIKVTSSCQPFKVVKCIITSLQDILNITVLVE